jgi:hypothetical protein
MGMSLCDRALALAQGPRFWVELQVLKKTKQNKIKLMKFK